MPWLQIFSVANMSFTLFVKIKFSLKNSGFTVTVALTKSFWGHNNMTSNIIIDRLVSEIQSLHIVKVFNALE